MTRGGKRPGAGRKPDPELRRLRGLLSPHADQLVGKAVQLALEGNVPAIRLCMERLVPPLRASDQPVRLPALQGSLADQAQQLMTAVAAGEITPDTAASLMQVLAAQARIIEISELEQRIASLEGANAHKP